MEHRDETSVLLTDDAVRAAWSPGTSESASRNIVRAFLHHHATEGREVLLEAVARAIFSEAIADNAGETGAYDVAPKHVREWCRWVADPVVTRLVGARPPT